MTSFIHYIMPAFVARLGTNGFESRDLNSDKWRPVQDGKMSANIDFEGKICTPQEAENVHNVYKRNFSKGGESEAMVKGARAFSTFLRRIPK